jgi:hypothetical protein
MTPKAKAVEIFEQCGALIQIAKYHKPNTIQPTDKTAALNYANSEIKYWQEVKQEIEKL